MTPKEKAIELFDKFHEVLPSYADEGQIEWQSAKKCALIAVDEILNDYLTLFMDNIILKKYEYWQEVKKEIEAL